MANSRDWICVRLATYESAEEAEILKTMFTGRSGELENTTFVLLASDGKTKLSRAGRSPSFFVGDRRRGGRGRSGGGPDHKASSDQVKAFASMLGKYAKKAKSKKKVKALPLSLDFRRALNIAACDNQPLVVVYSKKESLRTEAEKSLAALCWSKDFVGKAQYAVVSSRKELDVLTKLPQGEGVFLVEPGSYGLDGKVVAQASLKTKGAKLTTWFAKSLKKFDRKTPNKRRLLRQGRRKGIEWKSAIEVTDPEDSREQRDRRPR